MQAAILLQQFIEQTTKLTESVVNLQQHGLEDLRWREAQDSWSVLECLEHLNLYGDYYLPEIAEKIINSNTSWEPVFHSSWLGNYFAKSMLPKQKLNKMKTFKDKNPIHKALDLTVIDRFLEQQQQLLLLLEQAKAVSLNKVKIQISLSKYIRIRLGDAFGFYINHMLRHMQQIERVALALSQNK